MVTNDGNVPDAAEALNQEWDALVHPGGPAADAARPSALRDAVRELHARDDAPVPDAAFAARLWHDLVDRAPVSGPMPVRAERTRSIGIVPPAFGLPGPLLPVAIAAAIVLAVIGGSWSDRSIFAPFAVGSPTVAAREAGPVRESTVPAVQCAASPTPGPDPTATAVPVSEQACAANRWQ